MSGVIWHNASWWPVCCFAQGWGHSAHPWMAFASEQQSLLPRFLVPRSSRPLLTFVGSLLVGVAILDPRWSVGH